MPNPAYVDVFRRLTVINSPSSVDINADAVDDTLTFIAGTNMQLVPSAAGDTVTFNGPDFQLFVPVGTTDLRLSNVSTSTNFDVTMTAGAGMQITRTTSNELNFESFAATETDTLQSVALRGAITDQDITANNITIGRVVSTLDEDGFTSFTVGLQGNGTLGSPLTFTPTTQIDSSASNTVTITFTSKATPGVLSYSANYIANTVLTTGSVTLERETPSSPGTWVTLDNQTGTSVSVGYAVSGTYSELSSAGVNYRITWAWTGSTGSVNYSTTLTYESVPAADDIVLETDSSAGTVYVKNLNFDSATTGGIQIFDNNIIGLNSNEDILITTSGTGAVRLEKLRTSDATIALGLNAGLTNQGISTVAIGIQAGETNQGASCVAIGAQAGATGQGVSSIAIGSLAGNNNQDISSVAIGGQAGENNQGLQSIAVGSGAGNLDQDNGAVAVGANAGAFYQGQRAVAIGSLAGSINQGDYAVALGNFAGGSNQPANSIIINATGLALNGSESGFHVDPIRAQGGNNFLVYNTSTKEITYQPGGAFSFYVAGDDSVAKEISTGEEIKFIGAGGITTATDAEGNVTISGPGFGNFTFTASTLDTFDSSGITITPLVTLESDLVVGNDLTVSGITTSSRFFGPVTGDVTGNVIGNVTGDVSGNAGTVTNGVYTTGSYADPTWITSLAASKVGLGNVTNESKATMFTAPTFTGTTTLQQSTEILNTKTGATGTVVHDFSTGSIWYHSSISADFTANFTNVPTTNDRTISMALILAQGGTAYIPTAVEINSSSVAIKWQDATPPSGNANQVDLVSFTLIRTGAVWTAVGSLSTFG
jgi:hypothetical protein